MKIEVVFFNLVLEQHVIYVLSKYLQKQQCVIKMRILGKILKIICDGVCYVVKLLIESLFLVYFNKSVYIKKQLFVDVFQYSCS